MFLIEKTLIRLIKIKIFIKLNIRQVFYRIKIKESIKNLIIFRIKYGSYKYKILLFKLYNDFIFFQRYINDVLFNYLDDFYTIYVNNIFIYSDNLKDYKI